MGKKGKKPASNETVVQSKSPENGNSLEQSKQSYEKNKTSQQSEAPQQSPRAPSVKVMNESQAGNIIPPTKPDVNELRLKA